jgi:hypothetical protein
MRRSEAEPAHRAVHLERGEIVVVHAGVGVEVILQRFASGSVGLRDAKTGRLLRTWAPKEASAR